MMKRYIVARNAFTVAAPEGLRAWELIEPRFRPFAAVGAAEKPVLEVDIRAGELPECVAERIYEPGHGGVGVIEGRASRLPDGGTVMEFSHVDEPGTRLMMTMPREFDRAEIVIKPMGDANDANFLTHALMIAYMLSTCGNGTLLIHASAVVYAGRAYLFQGKSGTGKSTHAALWTRNVAGAQLLNDDNPVIRAAADGLTAMAYGSPWSGKTSCYRNLAAPIGALVRIVRDSENFLRRLDPLRGYASLTASIFFMPFLSEELRGIRHRAIERLAMTIPCCEMHCRPDADAALTCKAGVAERRKKLTNKITDR